MHVAKPRKYRAALVASAVAGLTVALGLGTLTSPATAAIDPEAVLLSYNKPAEASTSQNDGNCWECVPGRAFDHDPASRWATSEEDGWVDDGWISVDLGTPAEISHVVLQWDPAYATAYELQVSDDNQSWTTIYETTSGSGFKETVEAEGSGRYVRMLASQRSSPYGYSLWEFQVYGTGGDPQAPPTPQDPQEPLELVFSDEFDGPANSTVDPDKWTSDPGTAQNNELQVYTEDANTRMDGEGHLVIEARREETPGTTCPVDPLSGSTTCQYTSGRINTYGTFDFTYGRVEARIQLPSGQGLWPAFWMLGSSFYDDGRPWPHTGEIDIMEHVGLEPNAVHSTLHAPAYFGAGGYGDSFDLGEPANADFHVFALDWDSQGMVFTVDDQVVHTVDREELESTVGPWVFDNDFFLILNTAVGGDWPGAPDESTVFPQRMAVDYVRVYQ